MLYIVPTPIGNLEDITLRALRILKEADLIVAEDTRTTKKLLDHFNIVKPIKSYHAHNEHAIVQYLVGQLQQGITIALVSDAGTPSISDPGFLLVREAQRADVKICALPGATAFVPALVASALPSNNFFFEGFLPHKKGRQTRLKYLATLECTFILYESPHRIVKNLEELIVHCGQTRQACICRELTKIYEEIRRATLAELLAAYKNDEAVLKGEFVIVVAGVNEK